MYLIPLFSRVIGLLLLFQFFGELALPFALQLGLIAVNAQERHNIRLVGLVVDHDQDLAEGLQQHEDKERYGENSVQKAKVLQR